MAEDVGRMVLMLARKEEEEVLEKLRGLSVSDAWAEDVSKSISALVCKKEVTYRLRLQGTVQIPYEEPTNTLTFWYCLLYAGPIAMSLLLTSGRNLSARQEYAIPGAGDATFVVNGNLVCVTGGRGFQFMLYMKMASQMKVFI